jgi:RNA polymerase sigma-70 factor (ECF subfamily)
VDSEFVREADPYRRELLAHCYRMLGSVYDAEDLVQETYVRAWRSYDNFEGRSSMRTWLHKIATNACLNALESRQRRPLPVGLGAPSCDPADDLVERQEVPWLEPMPDALFRNDPAAVVTGRESVRLAVVAAMQFLPARQRAVLILRDVLQWPAAEVAGMLGMTTASVNSALHDRRRPARRSGEPRHHAPGHHAPGHHAPGHPDTGHRVKGRCDTGRVGRGPGVAAFDKPVPATAPAP